MAQKTTIFDLKLCAKQKKAQKKREFLKLSFFYIFTFANCQSLP